MAPHLSQGMDAPRGCPKVVVAGRFGPGRSVSRSVIIIIRSNSKSRFSNSGSSVKKHHIRRLWSIKLVLLIPKLRIGR